MRINALNEKSGSAGALFSSSSPVRTAWRWWLLALFIASFDLLSKAVTQAVMPHLSAVTMTSFFNYGHWRNTGAAFSFLADAGGWQRYFFVAFAGAVSVWLVHALTKPLHKLERWAFSLILGGAVGNGMDRAFRGYVVDFLDFHWRGMHWPAFNMADIAIILGAALMIAGAFLKPRP